MTRDDMSDFFAAVTLISSAAVIALLAFAVASDIGETNKRVNELNKRIEKIESQQPTKEKAPCCGS